LSKSSSWGLLLAEEQGMLWGDNFWQWICLPQQVFSSKGSELWGAPQELELSLVKRFFNFIVSNNVYQECKDKFFSAL
jgi:hypothetical protein